MTTEKTSVIIRKTPEGIVYALTPHGLILMAGGNNVPLLESISDPTEIEFLGIKIRTLKPETVASLTGTKEQKSCPSGPS